MSNDKNEFTQSKINENNIPSESDSTCGYKHDHLVTSPEKDNCIKDDNSTSSEESFDTKSDEEQIYVDKAIFGDWGCHYLLTHPWAEAKKPTVKVFDYAKLKLTDTEKEGILSDRIVASCSSYLDKSPYINKYVMCKCVLSNKLLKNIDVLTYHHYLQYLDLSNNELTSLKPLGQLPFLMYLDASKNQLTEVLDFKAPFYLTYVNYSYNCLMQIRDLSDFWSICFMDLSHNYINKICGLQNLKYLRNLNLAYNQIECIENLNNMNLQLLQLQCNKITKCEGGAFLSLIRLISLDLSYNQLNSLKFFHNVHNLQEINMIGNKIDCLMQLNYLRGLLKLTKLDLKENPVASKPDYYVVCIDCVCNITFLDGNYITATEKMEIKLQFAQQSDFRSSVLHGRLLSIEHLQSPFIGYHVMPIDQPPPAIIVLVGTIASKKGDLVREFCKENPRYTVVGVSHTTRPKTVDEVDHEAYHFVTIDEFRDILKQGKFISVYEFLGNCFGFAESELEKVRTTDKVLVTHLSLEGALLLRNRGLNPILVLAMPLDPANHLDFLRYKYYQTLWDPTCFNILKITNCPEKAELAREHEEKLEKLFKTNVCKNIINEIVNDLPEDPYDIEDVRSVQTLDKKSCSTTARYPKGFSVTFQNTDNLSVPNDYHLHSRSESSDPSFKETTSADSEGGGIGESISKTLDLGGDDIALSVLSKVNVDTDTDDRENLPQLGMKLDEINKHSWFLEQFYNQILWLREFYFQQHNFNPGLFSAVIFTDDFSSCLEKLKIQLKKCVELRKHMQPVVKIYEDDAYQSVIRERLKLLHIALKRGACVKYDLLQEFEGELEAATAPYFDKVDRAPEYTQTKTLFKK